ncbi:MAG: hypothetical protein HYX47_23285 [Burkholderiales bacterium]|nr:hypothetical protein [Burkholderiales bacterium]
MAATPSPDGLQLRQKPKASARLNRKALFVMGGVLAAIAVFVLMNLASSPKEAAKKVETTKAPRILAAENAGQELTRDVPDIAPARPPLLDESPAPAVSHAPEGVPPLQSQAARPAQQAASDPDLQQALRSDTALSHFMGANSAPPAPAPVAAASMPAAPASAARKEVAAAPPDPNEPANEPDLNRQAQKREFLDKGGQPQGPAYKVARPQPPLSRYEIKTGSILPALLITQINSDLPGDIVAQVSQNVYDSVSGRYLLVPQGTKLYGHYDSGVAFGQDRLLVVWSRLIYPNGDTIDLGGMAAVDKAGMAGLADKVNHHYVRTFSAALLTSLFTAGMQLSQPLPAPGSNVAMTTQQVGAGAVGQQMGQLGLEIVKRNLRVQPTIEVRRGSQFSVMVSKDLVFPSPYVDMR